MLDSFSKIIAAVAAAVLCATALFNIGYFSIIGLHFSGIVDLTNIVYTVALFAVLAIAVVLIALSAADTFSMAQRAKREKSTVLWVSVAFGGLAGSIGLATILYFGLSGISTFYKILIFSQPLVAGSNLSAAIFDWRDHKKISYIKWSLATTFALMTIFFTGRIIAENQAMFTKQTYELKTDDETFATARIVRSSSAGILLSYDGTIAFIPMGKIKSIKSNEKMEPIAYEKSKP